MHSYFLLQALQMAETRRGYCAPNPAVGAVVVKNGQIIADGCHYAPGSAHAEVEALTKAGEKAQQSTLYVTLEPCNHWGRTPPCVDAIIQAGVKHVIYGYNDPNHRVEGQGQQKLQAHGISCVYLPHDEINAFYQSYTHWLHTKQPFVTAKLALSLDGKIAGKNREPIAITSDTTNQFTHRKRSQSDAILTTCATVNTDDPQLNVRLENCSTAIAKPLYVLDRRLSLFSERNIYETAGPLTIFSTVKTHNQQTKYVPEYDEQLDLTDILMQIGRDGYHDLWVEAGGRLFRSLLQQKLLHRAYLYFGPITLGVDAYPAFDEKIDLRVFAKQISWQSSGHDAICQIDFI